MIGDVKAVKVVKAPYTKAVRLLLLESSLKQVEKSVIPENRTVCNGCPVLTIACFCLLFAPQGSHFCSLFLVLTVNWGRFWISPNSFKGRLPKD